MALAYFNRDRHLGGRDINPSFSIPSIIALIAAVISIFKGGSMLWAIVAIVAGVIGVVIALSPAKRGGIVSILSIVMGAIAIVLAIVRFVVPGI